MPDRQRADEQLEARIRESFERQGLMAHLGAELLEVAEGRVRIGLRRREEVAQQHGYVHAGATGAIADSAGAYAAQTLYPEGAEVLAVEYKLNLLSPAVGERIEAVGTVLKSGRTLSVSRIDVFSIDGEGAEKLIAAGQQTCIRVEG